MSCRGHPLAPILGTVALALSACTQTVVKTVLVPFAADAGPAEGAIDVELIGACEAICLQALSISSDDLIDCHNGAAPGGAAVWCTYEETVWLRP